MRIMLFGEIEERVEGDGVLVILKVGKEEIERNEEIVKEELWEVVGSLWEGVVSLCEGCGKVNE